MSKLSESEHVSLLNRVSAAVSAILLVLHFVPFWKYGDGMSASIGGLVWLPYNHTGLTAELAASIEGFTVDSLAGRSALLCILCLAALFFCLLNSEKYMFSLLPISAGIAGVWAFLSSPALRLGSGWIIQLVLSVLLLLVGILTFLMGLKSEKA